MDNQHNQDASAVRTLNTFWTAICWIAIALAAVGLSAFAINTKAGPASVISAVDINASSLFDESVRATVVAMKKPGSAIKHVVHIDASLPTMKGGDVPMGISLEGYNLNNGAASKSKYDIAFKGLFDDGFPGGGKPAFHTFESDIKLIDIGSKSRHDVYYFVKNNPSRFIFTEANEKGPWNEIKKLPENKWIWLPNTYPRYQYDDFMTLKPGELFDAQFVRRADEGIKKIIANKDVREDVVIDTHDGKTYYYLGVSLESQALIDLIDALCVYSSDSLCRSLLSGFDTVDESYPLFANVHAVQAKGDHNVTLVIDAKTKRIEKIAYVEKSERKLQYVHWISYGVKTDISAPKKTITNIMPKPADNTPLDMASPKAPPLPSLTYAAPADPQPEASASAREHAAQIAFADLRAVAERVYAKTGSYEDACNYNAEINAQFKLAAEYGISKYSCYSMAEKFIFIGKSSKGTYACADWEGRAVFDLQAFPNAGTMACPKAGM